VCDTTNSVHYVAYDGKGSVMALLSATNGVVSANYEYGPFGELLRAIGPLARANPFRYSTKYEDEEIGLVYYGYRCYNASVGRWLSRDPMGERGGLNLYGFNRNEPNDFVDPLGDGPRPLNYNNRVPNQVTFDSTSGS